MEKRAIPGVSLPSTVLGLGCWAFGGGGWVGQTDEDSADAIAASLEAGVNHFDTAVNYGSGRSETVVGNSLGNRQGIVVATKLWPNKVSAKDVDESLRRLKRSTIDVLYIHWPRKGHDMRPAMEVLEEARAKGKIRSVGVSNFSVEQMQQVMEVGTIDAHQLCYNLLWRWDEKDIIPFCIEHKIAIVAYSSIAQGILTGKFGKDPGLVKGDVRSNTVMFERDVWPHVYEGVEHMKDIAKQADRSLTTLAMQWVAAQPGVTTVLVGARNRAQAVENAAAFEGQVTPSFLASLTAISDEVIRNIPDSGNIFRYYP